MISDARLQAAIDSMVFTEDDPEAVLYDAAMEARAEVRKLKRILRQIRDAEHDWQRVNLATFALSPRPRTTNRSAQAQKGTKR